MSSQAMRLLAPLALFAGCYSPVSELIGSHVEPGGAIAATLGSAPAITVKALADGTVDPMTIDGSSPVLVFGLILGNDVLTGMPSKALVLAGDTVQLTIAAGSQLSVHMLGMSCVTTTATVNLKPDGKGNIDGDFTGSGSNCTTSGTLMTVPIDTTGS